MAEEELNFARLSREFGSEEGITIFSPVMQSGYDFRTRREIELYYTMHNYLARARADRNTSCTKTKKGYKITEHERRDYSDDSVGVLFKVEPFSPTARLRNIHYATSIRIGDLIEKLKRELELDKQTMIEGKSAQGYAVLTQNPKGEQ